MRLKDKIFNSKKLKKVLSTTLATFLVFNSISDVGVVLASEKTTLSIGQIGSSLAYIGDRSGNKLTFPKKEVKGTGQEAFCLEHSKLTPPTNGLTYTESGELDSGLAYIMSYKPNTGNNDKDYYIKQTAVHHYLGQINWIQYATTGTDIRDKAVALSNEAKSRANTKSNISITASPRQQDFKLVGNYYETDWYNVSFKGNLTEYRMDIKGQPTGTQIINSSGNVVSSLTQNDTKFKLRVPKANVNGNYQIKMRLIGGFTTPIAVEYTTTNTKYQKIGLISNKVTQAQDVDYLTANLVGNGSLELIKKSEDGSILQGAKFKLMQNGVDVTDVKTTDSNGRIIFTDIPQGNYDLVEVEAPNGHIIINASTSVTVNSGTTTTVEVSNTIIKGKVRVLKVDEETGEPLQGAEFKLKEKATGKVVETLVTGKDGTAISGLHTFGEYVLQETKAPNKYTLNSKEHFVTISEHMKTIEVTAENRIIKGKVAVNKTDSDIKGLALEGIEFEISNDEGQVVDTLVTDEKGYAISKELNYGKYFLKETKTLSTHILNDKVYEIDITEDGKVYTYDIENDVVKGKIQIVKVDKENEEAPIEGAIFDVIAENVLGIDNGTVVDTITSDENGFAYTKDLRSGTYKIVETFAPQGYWKSDKEYFVDVTENGKVYVRFISNAPIQAKLRVIKTDGKEKYPLANAKFKIVNKATGKDVEFKEFWGIIPIKKTVFKTDENGEFVTPQNLKYGTYELVEVEAPKGYNLAEPIEFTINENTPMEEIELLGTITTQEVINTRITGNMELLKVDEDTKDPLENVEFKLTCTDGFMKDKTWNLTSNQDGKVILNDIEYGKYEIKEVRTIEGYILNSEPIEFEVKENGKTIKLEMTNRKIKGFVEINKTDSKTDRVLEGVEFTIWDMNKKVVDKLVTDKKGYAKSVELDYGRYVMKETKADEDYIISEKYYDIAITEDGKVYTYNIKNNVKEGELDFSKTDVSSGEIVEGATIEITGLSETNNHIKFDFISDKEGNRFKLPVGKYEIKETIAPEGYVKTEEVGTFEIKENGEVVKAELKNKRIEGKVDFSKTDVSSGEIVEGATIKIECLEGFNKGQVIEFVSSKDGNRFELEYGKYQITETIAPEGYVKTEEVGIFEIKEDGEVVKAELKNKRIEGELDFSKTDVSSGEIVEGATIKIECLEGLNKGQVIEFVSSKDGNRIPLQYGKYQITETIAPEGYVKTEEVGTFEIKEDGEVVKAELKNKRIEGKVDFSKTDVSSGEIIEGATIKIECLEGFNKGQVIEFVSSKDGNRFELEYGKYQI